MQMQILQKVEPFHSKIIQFRLRITSFYSLVACLLMRINKHFHKPGKTNFDVITPFFGVIYAKFLRTNLGVEITP